MMLLSVLRMVLGGRPGQTVCVRHGRQRRPPSVTGRVRETGRESSQVQLVKSRQTGRFWEIQEAGKIRQRWNVKH